MSEHVGGDARPEVVLVVELARPEALAGDGEVVGLEDRDLEVERQRHRQAVESRSEVGRTGGYTREHGFTVCGARAWARRQNVVRAGVSASPASAPRSNRPPHRGE